jgi:hypothetical protein
VGHLREHGFAVRTIESADVGLVKMRYQVPADLASCHTALVDGYVIEGHVPAAEVRRLLRERPAIVGLAVAGMPEGSPGMEGARREPYDVIAFGDLERRIFASYRP